MPFREPSKMIIIASTLRLVTLLSNRLIIKDPLYYRESHFLSDI